MPKLFRWSFPLFVLACLGLATPSHADFVRIEENHVSVRYEGDWRTVSGAGVSGGTVRVSNAAGARVHVFFRGTGISLIGYRCNCAIGTAWMSVDGTRRTLVQGWTPSSSPEAMSVIRTIDGLDSGTHVLTLELTGNDGQGNTANASFVVDAFDIENGRPMRRIEENDPAITFTGEWMDIDDPSVSAGSVLATRELGATATLRFSGNALEWIGYGCPCTGGIVDITVDGQSSGPLSNMSTIRQPQHASFSTTTLPDGDHEMTLRVTGANVDAPPWVVVDALAIDVVASDSAAPTVTMTAPADNASVTGVVTLEAAAQDNVGVTKVQFFAAPAGGSTVLLGEDTSGPFTLTRDTSTIASGSQFRLWTRAWDGANNYAQSPTINVRVNHTGDTTPPVLTITEPADGSTVSGTINLSATATDENHISSVRFVIDFLSFEYIMTAPITEPPYTMRVDTLFLKDGLHRLEATARDVSGNTSTQEIRVTVDNSVQPNSVRVDDTHPAISFNGGTWTRETDGEAPRFHWDGATYSSTVGATVTGTFQGSGLRWHGFRCEFCGVATISIDGGPPQVVDTYYTNLPGQTVNLGTVVYSSPTLASGTHTVTLTVQPSPSPRPANHRVYVDAFEVLR